jgi:hypothetical protein
MKYLVLLILFVSSYSQETREIYLKSHLLSSLRLPEPFIDVIQPIKGVISIKPASGHNKRILVLKSNTKKRGKTNLLIYTKNYEFNFVVFLNHDKHDPTVVIKRQNIVKSEKTSSTTLATSAKVDIPSQIYSLDSLNNKFPNLLEPTSNAVSNVNSSVTFGLDNIFYYKDKILFKFSLFNKSKVPFDILSIKISYTESEGIALISEEETKNISLFPFNISYSNNSKKVNTDSISHILYAVDKIGVKDDGNFSISLKEKDGNRHFELSSKSIIGRVKN